MSTRALEFIDQPVMSAPAISVARPFNDAERKQKAHYDEIAEEYDAHYSDATSREYRDRFIHGPMFEGIELAGMRVLDAMCGSGQTTRYLFNRGALVTGLDISAETIESFQSRWPACDAVCRSALDTGFPENSFDCVAVVGGLHHLHPNLSEAVAEIHRVLKPGGHFCFMEPHSGSLPDIIRRVWYKHDSLFSDNEAAIDLRALQSEFGSRFEFRRIAYMGNMAFLLVLNSMVFRIPPAWKPSYARAALALESIIGKFQTKLSSCFVVAQWRKK